MRSLLTASVVVPAKAGTYNHGDSHYAHWLRSSSALPLPLWERVGERGSIPSKVTPLPETSLRFVSDLSHKGRGEERAARTNSDFKELT